MKSLFVFFVIFCSTAFADVTAPRNGEVRILPLGDSITEGSNDLANYRVPLCRKLEEKGYKVESVGFRTLKNVDKTPGGAGKEIPERWWSHTGISGQRVWSDGFRAGYLDSLEPLLDQAGSDIDVIVFKIGTNDLMRNCPVDKAFEGYKTLLKTLMTKYPTTRIVVCSILDMPGKKAQVDDYNGRIKSLAEKLPKNQIFFADLNAVVVRENGDFLDAFHPNGKGHDHTSDVLAKVVEQAIKAPKLKPRKSKNTVTERDELKKQGYKLAKTIELPAEGGFELPEVKGEVAYLMELKRPGKDHSSRVAVAYPGAEIKYEPTGYGRFQAWKDGRLLFAFNRFGEEGVNEIGIGQFEQHYLGNNKYSKDYTHTWATPTMNASAYEKRKLEIWTK